MARFCGFVVFAEMRTGSNYLEALLASCPGIACHGEVFNPAFLGRPGRARLFGLDRAARDADPRRMLDRLRRRSDGLAGFRFFHDHDPRALDAVLADRRWAKVLLSRDPAESYVSFKIALATDQWRLTAPQARRAALVHFDIEEFDAFHAGRARFRAALERRLQIAGQAAYRLDYADLGDAQVIAGLLAYLGSPGMPDPAAVPLLRQNPGPLAARLSNPDALVAARARLADAGVRPPPSSAPP